MTPKQIATDYTQTVWIDRQIDEVDRFVASDLVQHNPNLPDGAEPLKAFLGKLFGELAPAMDWRILRVIAEDDLVAVHSLAIRGPGDRGSSVVDLYRIAGDRIVEHWDVSHDVPETTASGRSIY